MSYLDEWADARDQTWEQRVRQLGTRTPVCASDGCQERDPFALTGTAPDIWCYECRAMRAGRATAEGHHIRGRRNDAHDVVDVPGNDHRVLSAMQAQWDTRTLRNPDASPLLRAAAALRGWLDVLTLIVDRTVGWVPAFLEALDAALVERIGARWWTTLDLARAR